MIKFEGQITISKGESELLSKDFTEGKVWNVILLSKFYPVASSAAKTSFTWNDAFEQEFPRVSTHLCREKYMHFSKLDHARRSTIFSHLAQKSRSFCKSFYFGKRKSCCTRMRSCWFNAWHTCLARAIKGYSGLEKFRSQQVMLEMEGKKSNFEIRKNLSTSVSVQKLAIF